jgi:hypothetical protein
LKIKIFLKSRIQEKIIDAAGEKQKKKETKLKARGSMGEGEGGACYPRSRMDPH